jgi:tetratricopeptide (TPR) repeat protein
MAAAYGMRVYYERALDYLSQALVIQRELADRHGEAVTLNNIGAICEALNDDWQALKKYEEFLPIRQEVGDLAGEAISHYNIAGVYKRLGKLESTVTEMKQVVRLRELIQHPNLENDKAILDELIGEQGKKN